MKQFFKSVLATITGLLIFFLVIAMLGVMSLVGIVASGQASKSVKDNSVLVINLSGMIKEQASEDVFTQLTGGYVNTMGLNEVLAAVRKAAADDKVKGIYLEAGAVEGSYATLQEIRNALVEFKKTKKWIMAYGDIYAQGAYYVASVADKVYINPKGMLDWRGMASQPMYIKDLAAKFGVKYQVVKVGKYKSATEYYTEDRMSDANRSQVSAFVGGVWKNVCRAVSDSRGVSVDSLNAYADRMMTLADPSELKRMKMVDGLVYGDEVKKLVKMQMGMSTDDEICQVSVNEMANAAVTAVGRDQIAVYYMQGTIVRDAVSSVFSQDNVIIADEVCRDLEALMNDDDVKAVVLRVNSGGGDAFASELIWHQVEMLKAKKPVVVSMGDYAASGGYYLGCGASWIVAQPNTLTGSIGIFGVFPDYSELVTKKLGVKFDVVKTNKMSDFGNVLARPLSGDEVGVLTAYINRGYQLFRQRVADGRKMAVPAVEEIAQGHVWLATDAKNIKLVDQLGGLPDAVAKAAQLSKTGDYYTVDYPAPDNVLTQMMKSAQRGNYLDEQMRLAMGDMYEPFMMIRNISKRSMIKAQMPFVINMK